MHKGPSWTSVGPACGWSRVGRLYLPVLPLHLQLQETLHETSKHSNILTIIFQVFLNQRHQHHL